MPRTEALEYIPVEDFVGHSFWRCYEPAYSPDYTPRSYIIPTDVVAWAQGETIAERPALFAQGLRYSPSAIATLAKYRVEEMGFAEEGFVPDWIKNDFGYQQRRAIGHFLLAAGIISLPEFCPKPSVDPDAPHPPALISGQAPFAKILNYQEGLLLRSDDLRVRNTIRTDTVAVARDLTKIRAQNTEATVVLAHGRWNGFPHQGYLLMFLEALTRLEKMGIAESNVVFVVMGDTNKDIGLAAYPPFLNTAWRLSLMAALPWPDLLCPAADFSSWQKASHYWISQYRLLKPDFVIIDPQHNLFYSKLQQSQAADIETLLIDSRHLGVEVALSQTKIRSLAGNPTTLLTFEQTLFQLEQGKKLLPRTRDWREYY